MSTMEEPAKAAAEEIGPRFFNRDISWLEFNQRVLAQAADASLPILERARFLAIFSSNLDEFFMKRVGLVKRQVHAGLTAPGADGLTPRQQLNEIRGMAQSLQAEQVRIYEKEVLPELEKSGISITRYADLNTKDRAWADQWYMANVFPALTPLAVDPAHRFPFISNLSESLAIIAEAPAPLDPAPGGVAEEEPLFARLKIPPGIPRFVALPDKGKAGQRFVRLQAIIRNNLDDLFPGMKVLENVIFRVTRSAGIQKDDIDTANLLQSVEADLKQRKFARVVRMQIEADPSPTLLHWLRDKLNLDSSDVYEQRGMLDYSALIELCELARPDLKNKPWKPVIPPRLVSVAAGPVERTAPNFFGAIRKQDILLHHPYESFNTSVERFIASAAADPDVVTIKQTLYRTSPDSPFIESLVRAAESGKQVACLVELRARFDEDRNVRFARRLEKAGVHVAYGVVGLKTHCKTSLVVRKEKSGLRCYAHLGTGNYHPKTAQLYTDVGLLTADPSITGDLVNLFNYLTGLAATQHYSTLLVAPFNMRQKFYQLIEREIENAKKKRPARIVAKMNSLEDREVAERLYAASAAGVSVTIVCRGFCCLRPGVPGLSENIRVMSVVGRFLEHSRIFHFAAGREEPTDGDWYIGSADWMYRNLSNRVEAAVPVRDSEAKARLARILEVHEQDRRFAWDLKPDGSYERRSPRPDAAPDSTEIVGSFASLMRDALTEPRG